jgi:hypothetical protein
MEAEDKVNAAGTIRIIPRLAGASKFTYSVLLNA